MRTIPIKASAFWKNNGCDGFGITIEFKTEEHLNRFKQYVEECRCEFTALPEAEQDREAKGLMAQLDECGRRKYRLSLAEKTTAVAVVSILQSAGYIYPDDYNGFQLTTTDPRMPVEWRN